MKDLLPLLVVIPLGAAFLIPLLHLLVARRGRSVADILAVVFTGALVVLSVVLFFGEDTVVTWIGGYKGERDLLGLSRVEKAQVPDARGREGLLVQEVASGSAAHRAGISQGDLIVGYARGGPDAPRADFQGVTTLNTLRRFNAGLPYEGALRLTVFREGRLQEVHVTAGKSVTGIAVVSDGLTRLLLLVITVVSFAAMLFSINYMRAYTQVHLYYSPIMLMVAGMCGVVISGDLFNIYVFLEVAAVASYALVGFGVESEELEASFKYLVLSAVASGFILLGIGIVYGLRGTLNLAQLAADGQAAMANDAMWLALGFFVAGFGLKAAMVPFHAWLPDAHPSAPAPVSAMLSGVLIKACGVYVLARLVFNVLGASTAVAWVLMLMGILSMVVGVFLAVGQWDFKRLLAYHSISQMGYVVLALGVGAEVMVLRGRLTPHWELLAAVAVGGGLFHLLNHAAFKSLLFLTSGSIVHSAGTRQLKKLGGMGRQMPVTSWLVRVGSLSISGVPPFNGFFSKLLIVVAVVWAGHWVLGALTVLVSFMTLLSFTKVQRYVIEGDVPEALRDVRESPVPMLAAMGILGLACLLLGVLLPLHGDFLLRPAADALTGGLFEYASTVLGG